MQIKTNYIAFVKACIRAAERLNAGTKGFWEDTVQEDGSLLLDGKPHGLFSLVAKSGSSDEVVKLILAQ